MAPLSQDRLVRKEVALGQVREIPPPMQHIGLTQIAPILSVQSDDVVFQYVTPDVDGLAPARAEDAESELAQKDDTFGTGRASLIDWAIKDHYDPSDVSRYREFLRLAELSGGASFPLTVGNMTEDFQRLLSRDAAKRRRKLDNRLEWLIWQALETGVVSYNDGTIKFTADFARPANQTDEQTATGPGTPWSNVASDPINDLLVAQQYMMDTYSVRVTRGYISSRVLRNILNSTKFTARSGLAPGTGIDPRYLIDGWGYEAARAVVERATGISLTVYDAVYRTRAIGSTTVVNNRFMSDNKVILLPDAGDIDTLDDTEIGFAKTLSSPHPEGGWTSGFYEWEKSDVDPWGHDRGTGIKAFPVFPHLDKTYTMVVL
jgi:hypothetical protein